MVKLRRNAIAQGAATVLASLALVSATTSEAGIVFSTEDGLAVVQNTDVSFDKGNFFLDGKQLALVIPENPGTGLAKGAKLFLKAIDLGETPTMWGILPADRIVLEREADGGKWMSQPRTVNSLKPIISTVSGSVPRIEYAFDAIATAVGDRFKLTFLDNSGATMGKVRYAVGEINDGRCVFENLSFTANRKNYCPVYSLRIATKAEEPKLPPPTTVEPEKKAKEPEPKPEPAPQPPARNVTETAKEPPKAAKKEHSVTLSIDRPKRIESTEQDNEKSYRGFSYNRDVEVKSIIHHYKGKVSCVVPKNENAEITVEAYFVVRDIARGSKDRIDGCKVVGRYKFGGDSPQTQLLDFKSPAIDETKVRRSYSGHGGGMNKSDSFGARYIGVIVRALEDGKVRKVVAIPSNQKWVKIGRQETVDFDDDSRPSRDTDRGDQMDGNEPLVHTRLEGTGASTPPGWMDDFYKAQEIAQKENKLLFVVFSGSDWCGYCKVLAEKVLKTVRFQKALKNGYIPVFIDSPRDQSLLSDTCRKQNKDIAQMLSSHGGVPDVNIFNADGKRLVRLGGASHIENGVSSYLKFFESVDRGLRLVNAVKISFRAASAKSPEYLKAMHEALMQIDDSTLVDNFCNEAEDLVAADKSYLKFYPYLEFVAPLEKATRELDVSLSQKTFYAMKRDKVPYNPKDERKYRRKFFEADNCLSKYNAILDKVKAAEATVRNEDALERLKKLRLGIMRSVNDN